MTTVEQRSRNEQQREAANHLDATEIYIDGERTFAVWDGEPEDATLSRNFNACFSVIDLMMHAYEAGIRGDKVTFESIDDLCEIRL